MGTKDNKTDTNGECGHDTHLSNTECKRVETVNVLKDLNKSQDSFVFLIHEAADIMSKSAVKSSYSAKRCRVDTRTHSCVCVCVCDGCMCILLSMKTFMKLFMCSIVKYIKN